ncbi:MAG: methylmalonyl Co-A mutase-associated GTPase MeaB [Desulfobacterales bacterium]|nr:methylmalonyl Co-A mutase-associated GTPase MeaB [Desulfobacterales bacterium]
MVYDADALISGVLKGNRRALARSITLFESGLKSHEGVASKVMKGLLPHAGGSLRLGVTGVPGVGKSSFIEAFGQELIGRGHKVAVLAVDPSSTLSQGSILGDKTRMEKLTQSPSAFIRPSPSGGTLGGVASRTREAMVACEAAGFDVIVVETVGVGQSETAVKGMVDHFLLLMLAGAGDEIQGIKRGIMELADMVAITKADGDNKKAAEKARQSYENALSLFLRDEKVPVITTSALTGHGIFEMANRLFARHEVIQRSGILSQRRGEQSVAWFWEEVKKGLVTQFSSDPLIAGEVDSLLDGIMAGSFAPRQAARHILQKYNP